MNLYYCQASNEMKLLFIFPFPETRDGFVVTANVRTREKALCLITENNLRFFSWQKIIWKANKEVCDHLFVTTHSI